MRKVGRFLGICIATLSVGYGLGGLSAMVISGILTGTMAFQ